MKCEACPLHKSSLSNCIPGRGPEDAEIMIVAQGPGAKEDMEGQVLIGPTGQKLNELLALAGYSNEKIFRTNATRCRAPVVNNKDRAPTPAEIDACREHLRAEIHRIQPKAIVALGDTALRSLCKLSGITGKRGKEFPLHKDFAFDAPVFPTYHPAFVLRNLMQERTVVSDLRRVRDREMPSQPIPWSWYGEGAIRFDGAIALDIETLKYGDLERRKDVYTDYPVQIAIASGNGVIVAAQADIAQACAPLPYQNSVLVTHNGWEFDIPKLQQWINPKLPMGRDTMVLAYLDDETQPLGLEALAVRYLSVKGWKEAKDAALGSDAFAEYNARDAYYTLQLYNVLVERLGVRVRLADEIIGPALTALRACSHRGIFIAQHVVADAKAQVGGAVEAARRELRGLTADPHFNPNAARQVAAFIESFGVKLPRTPKSQEPQVGKEIIAKYEGRTDALGEFCRTLLAYRTANKTLSTYITPYESVAEAKGGDGRVHNTYHVFKKSEDAGGTFTGRTSASGPNVQNLDRKYKGFFSAPPGFVRVEADYSAVEFRGAAWCAREPTIIAKYQENPLWDPHRSFAALLYRIAEGDVTKDQRQVAKSADFSQLYVGTAGTLIHYAAKTGVELNWQQAEYIHGMFHSVYNFKSWYQDVWEEIKAYGYVETATGRRRHFGNVLSLSKEQRVDALREAVNMKVQPTFTADLSLLALRACHTSGMPINYFCHDSIAFEFSGEQWAGEQSKLTEQIRWAMLEYPVQMLREKFGVELDIPLEIEITVTEGVK